MSLEDDAAEKARQAMARELGYFTESQVAQLAGVKVATLEAWRKRQHGPEATLFGNERLYPIQGVKSFLEAARKPRSRQHIIDSL